MISQAMIDDFERVAQSIERDSLGILWETAEDLQGYFPNLWIGWDGIEMCVYYPGMEDTDTLSELFKLVH